MRRRISLSGRPHSRKSSHWPRWWHWWNDLAEWLASQQRLMETKTVVFTQTDVRARIRNGAVSGRRHPWQRRLRSQDDWRLDVRPCDGGLAPRRFRFRRVRQSPFTVAARPRVQTVRPFRPTAVQRRYWAAMQGFRSDRPSRGLKPSTGVPPVAGAAVAGCDVTIFMAEQLPSDGWNAGRIPAEPVASELQGLRSERPSVHCCLNFGQ